MFFRGSKFGEVFLVHFNVVAFVLLYHTADADGLLAVYAISLAVLQVVKAALR